MIYERRTDERTNLEGCFIVADESYEFICNMYCIILDLSHSLFSKEVFWEQKIWNVANSNIHVLSR